jgi:hypothetical protein
MPQAVEKTKYVRTGIGNALLDTTRLITWRGLDMVKLPEYRHLARSLLLLPLVYSSKAHSNSDLGTTDSAGLALAALGLIVLLLGLHHLRDLRTKTLMPPGYRGRSSRRGSRPARHKT